MQYTSVLLETCYHKLLVQTQTATDRGGKLINKRPETLRKFYNVSMILWFIMFISQWNRRSLAEMIQWCEKSDQGGLNNMWIVKDRVIWVKNFACEIIESIRE